MPVQTNKNNRLAVNHRSTHVWLIHVWDMIPDYSITTVLVDGLLFTLIVSFYLVRKSTVHSPHYKGISSVIRVSLMFLSMACSLSFYLVRQSTPFPPHSKGIFQWLIIPKASFLSLHIWYYMFAFQWLIIVLSVQKSSQMSRQIWWIWAKRNHQKYQLEYQRMRRFGLSLLSFNREW